MEQVSNWGIPFAALMFTILSSVAIASWTLSGKISENRSYYKQEIARTRAETVTINNFREVVEKIYREMNEPIFALREHVGKVELYLEREFLQKKDYSRDQDKLLLAMKEGQEVCSKQFSAIETKIERLLSERSFKDVHS